MIGYPLDDSTSKGVPKISTAMILPEADEQPHEALRNRFSPTNIRATWNGTGSVEDASKALGISRSKGYELARRGEFPCRTLRIGRSTRVVTASLLRVLESGEPEYSGAQT
ncbi:helix-turn-helix domain-containing protein [Streptomyces noursei]|uniref:helix-turn-helix domain-containing protein n=1 Tax=Streptomyces noursei TaxID=1971 RepID=UPI0027E58167|nr:helix-turn-helix domain-containing protein [Streptomyces noursei]